MVKHRILAIGISVILALALSCAIYLAMSTPGASQAAPGAATVWQFATVDDAGNTGLYGDLALDDDNVPHLCYFVARGDYGDLLYATRDGVAWITETVDSVVGNSPYTSIALDRNGRPHIAYYDELYHELRYAHFNGTTWVSTTVDSAGDVGKYSSLALDGDDHPHISYYAVSGGDLRYAHYEGGSGWVTETLDSAGDVGQYTSLALDSGGYPHIGYYDVTNSTLKVKRYGGAFWQTGKLESHGDWGRFTSLALDASGDEHILLYDASIGAMMYATFDGSNFVTETIVSDSFYGGLNDLVLDSAGNPHISYADEERGVLIYGYDDGSGWQHTEIAWDMDNFGALALDSTGYPHIAYHDYVDRALKYAWEAPPVPPDALDLQGPATLGIAEWQFFTATVYPPTSTLPITFTWHATGKDQFQFVGDALHHALPYAWDSPGLKFVTVTAVNAGGVATASREVYVEPPPLPDLVVTHVWAEDDGTIWYSFENQGEISASVGSLTGLWVDNVMMGGDAPGQVPPGGSGVRDLGHTWDSCSGYTDTIRVTIDRTGTIYEANEANNTWEAVWECDRQGPIFTAGPDVEINGTTAIITWDTDELSSSAVSYGETAGEYDNFEYDSTDVLQHAITLTDLSEYTTYHYRIRSTDPGGYQCHSDGHYFETQGPITPPPYQTGFGTRYGGTSTYVLYAGFADVSKIERVDFYLDGEHIGSDFGGLDDEFKSEIPLGGRYGLRSDFFGKQHTISGTVFMKDGQTDSWQDAFNPSSNDDPIEVDVEITAPQDGHVVYVEGSSAPAGTMLDIIIDARQYEWDCDWVMLQGYYCGDFENPVESLQIVLNNSVIDTLIPTGFETTYPLDLSGYSAGTNRTIYVRAYDSDGARHDSQMVDFILQQVDVAEPMLTVDRDMAWHGNYFEVELTLENDATATANARIDYLEDNVIGFQTVHKDTATYDVEMDYGWDHTAKKSIITVDLAEGGLDYVTLSPGEQFVITYDLVPILYEAEYGYYIGAWDIKVFDNVGYVDAFHQQVSHAWLQNWAAQSATVSDYVLVTHPTNLFQSEAPNEADVNTLLSTMAHLATLKEGVLGYLEGTGNDPRNYLNSAISPGGNWATRLHSDFSSAGNGYVLIVGETEIVPAWMMPVNDKIVRHTDHPYADTSGNSSSITNGAPDLVVGRIVGNNAAALTAPLQASIAVKEDQPGHNFDRSHALLVSGTGGGQKWFYDNIDELETILTNDGVVVDKVHGIPFHIVDTFGLNTIAMGNYDPHDALAAGDVDGDGEDEIVLADRDDHFYVLDAQGNLEYDFGMAYNNAFEAGDRIAVGDVRKEYTGDVYEEILLGDHSVGQIRVYDQYGSPHVHTDFWDYSFGAYDGLAAGDVDADSDIEICIADRNDWIASYERAMTNAEHDFTQTFAKYDDLAVGDLMGDATEEIIVALGDYVYVYSADGTLLASLEYALEDGDSLAAGNVSGWPGDKEEIIIGDVGDNSIYSYWWDGGDSKFKRGLQVYWEPMTAFDSIAAGDVIAGGMEEIVFANQAEDSVVIADNGYCPDWLSAINPLTVDKDLLIFRGHGNTTIWDCLNDFPSGFGTAHPFLFAPSCLTGYYGTTADSSMPEMSFSYGAGAYIGSTEVSQGSYNFSAVKTFMQNWVFESAAKEFFDVERAKWGEDAGWRYWINEYNFYGDVKFGNWSPSLTGQSAAPRAVSAPSTTLTVDVPGYAVDVRNGIDYVTIPSGTLILTDGQPQVPYWTTFVEYPVGYQVQDVTLVSHSGLMTETNLHLPLNDDTLEQAGGLLAADAALVDSEDWFPRADLQYEWLAWENPEGTTTLMVKVYPFYYLPVSSYVRFYQHYTFDIDVISTTVAVKRLTTDSFVYTQGATVTVDLAVENTGAPQDVIVDATIRDSNDAVLDGLLLRTLQDLSGKADYTVQWDSAGFPAGDYSVVVELRDTEGHLLDQAAQDMRLGIIDGEVTSLSAAPAQFEVGETIDISLVFSNTGTVPITGTAVIQVRTGDTLTLTTSFTRTLANVLPNTEAAFDEIWDTTGVGEGQYNILGYVLYDGQATAPKSVRVGGGGVVYLPLVLRQAQ